MDMFGIYPKNITEDIISTNKIHTGADFTKNNKEFVVALKSVIS